MTASATGFGQPRATSRRDQTGAMTHQRRRRRHRQREPDVDGQLRRHDHQHQHWPASAGMACRRRGSGSPAMRWLPSRRRAARWRSAAPRRRNPPASWRPAPPPARGPISRAAKSTVPQTIVTLAPDTAVRCVSPAARNCAAVASVTADVSPRTSAGSIAAWSAGSVSRAAAANPPAVNRRDPLRRGIVPSSRLTRRGERGDGQVVPLRPGDTGPEAHGLTRRGLGERQAGRENGYPAAHFIRPRAGSDSPGTSLSRCPPTVGFP